MINEFRSMGAHSSYAHQGTPIRRSLEIAEVLRTFDLSGVKPQTLEDLWRITAPIREQIPELAQYNLSTDDSKREFPRTVAGLAILGCILRASAALEGLATPAETSRRLSAGESLMREYEVFAGPQDYSVRISLDQFTELVRLFQPHVAKPNAIANIAVIVVYGDLCKIPEIKQRLRESVGAEVADHDVALQEAFQPENLGKCINLFPTLCAIPEESQAYVRRQVLNAPNLGHILQCESGPAALTRLKEETSRNSKEPAHWLLPASLDIFASRANASEPETWTGSELGNANLVSAILVFARHLPTLQSNGELAFFDGFQKDLAQLPFYKPIFTDSDLTDREKDVVFRLAQYLSMKIDGRELSPLLSAYKARSTEEKAQLEEYFLNNGFDRENPKAVITYLPYVFTQLYANYFELPQAIDRMLDTMCSLLARVSDCEHYTLSPAKEGVRVYAGQDVWFNTLRAMTKSELEKGAIRLAVVVPEKTPEVILESELLSRSLEMREILLLSLQEATNQAIPQCASILDAQLSPVERHVFTWVNGHNFIDGSWYRPFHNLVVSQAMIGICQHTGASRDLVLAAMLHDIGYAGLNIPGTLQGAAWDSKDIREKHMIAGATMSKRFLTQLRATGALDLDEERIDKLVEIIATHDDPYLGRPLKEREALLHRDADRAFVISCVSFWKDYLAYLSDSKHITRFANENIKCTPEAFLELRRGSFEMDRSNQMARFTSYEPMESDTGASISQRQLLLRRAETREVLGALRAGSANQTALIELLRRCIIADFQALPKVTPTFQV